MLSSAISLVNYFEIFLTIFICLKTVILNNQSRYSHNALLLKELFILGLLGLSTMQDFALSPH